MNLVQKEYLKDKLVLVTGGTGFIGSNLALYLLSHGVKVRVLDNFSTSSKQIAEALAKKGAEIFECDIRNFSDCRNACEGVNVVFHHAALGSVQRSIKDPVSTNEVNVGGFVNMLTAARDAGIKRFIYASSSSVYGDDTTLPKTEALIGKPLSPYAVSKRANEEYAFVFAPLYGITIIGLRYFNVFGPGQTVNGPYAAVIPLFIDALLKNESPVIYGDGKTSRDFTFVSNVVDANINAACANLQAGSNNVFNIACGDSTSLNSLFEMLREFTGGKISPEYRDFRAGDIRDSKADISRATSIIGFTPAVSVQDGLEKTVDWWKQKFLISK